MSDLLQVAPLTELSLIQVNRLVTDINSRLVTIGTTIGKIQKTGSSDTVATLSDFSGGRGGDTVPKVPKEYTQRDIADAVASLARKSNSIIAKLQAKGIIA